MEIWWQASLDLFLLHNSLTAPVFLLPQANELSQLVGKAFKTAFACNSFKRDSKKQSSILDSMPPHLPSAAPRPWTVTTPPQSGHSPQTTPPGHTHQLEPISRPPPAVNPAAVTPGVSRFLYVGYTMVYTCVFYCRKTSDKLSLNVIEKASQ